MDALRRQRTSVIACLVGGTVITFLAAWACALWAPTGGLERDRPGDIERFQSDYPGPLRHGMFTKRVSGVGLTVISATTIHDATGEVFPTLYRAGLPWRCLEGTRRLEGGRSLAAWSAPRWLQPGWLSRGETRQRILPLRPLPLGFLANVLFWAALLWTLRQLRRDEEDDSFTSP